MSLILKVI
ncbi:UNVERIFIED_CONTAM: hypothetical protein GTU68_016594 [Idotea baltica]|nr:hypothetical protein [Idotea baltica]